MSYTTVDEVQGDFKGVTFSESTNVKASAVEQFIVEADSLINAYLGGRYTVPVTSGLGLNLLKMLSRSLVTSRIKKVLEVKNEKSTDANQSVVGVLLSTSQVMKILSDLRNGDVDLDGGVALSSGGGFYSQNVSDDIEPTIKKNEKQW